MATLRIGKKKISVPAEPESQLGTEARLRVAGFIRLLGNEQPEKVLLVGEGEGMLAQRLHESGAAITWLEPDSGDGIGGSSPLRTSGVRRILGNPLRLPFKDCEFDLAASQLMLEHITEPDRFLSEMARVVKRGGSLIVVTRNHLFKGTEQRPLPKAARDFTAQYLLDLMESFGIGKIESRTLLPDLRFSGFYRKDLSFCLRMEDMPYFGKRGRMLYVKGVKG
jgi:ubiquinone/menaquinone biosynthesis C-methylase UbiE